MSFFKACWTVVVPFLVLICVTLVMDLMGYTVTARLVSSIGTVVVLLANVVYIVGFHSRSRWPSTTWSERLKRLATFQR